MIFLMIFSFICLFFKCFKCKTKIIFRDFLAMPLNCSLLFTFMAIFLFAPRIFAAETNNGQKEEEKAAKNSHLPIRGPFDWDYGTFGVAVSDLASLL